MIETQIEKKNKNNKLKFSIETIYSYLRAKDASRETIVILPI